MSGGRGFTEGQLHQRGIAQRDLEQCEKTFESGGRRLHFLEEMGFTGGGKDPVPRLPDRATPAPFSKKEFEAGSSVTGLLSFALRAGE